MENWLVSKVVLIVVVVIVMSVDVVSCLSNMRCGEVVVVVSSHYWVNSVLLSVLMLASVLRLVVFWVSIVGACWLSVGVLVDIDNWVVVWVMWVVRISSWVGVDSLIIVMDSFMVNWCHLVASVPFNIMRDSLVWNSHIPFRLVMMMVIIVVSIVVVIMVVMSVLEGYSSVFIIMVEGAVINFMISFMIYEFMLNSVVLSLATFNMWYNLVNCCLLERPVV